MNIEAVIFDLDGTLVDSIDGITFAMNRVLESRGFPGHDRDTYRALVGNGLRELVRRSVPDGRADERLVDELFVLMKQEYGRSWSVGMRVYDGIAELLDRLTERGIPFAVNTNKEEEISRRIVSQCLPNWKFSAVAGGGAQVRKKPDPEGALLIASAFGVEPGRCAYVGDSEVDILTARNAGMFEVSVLWGFRSERELISAGARRIIHRPAELLEVLGLGAGRAES